MIISRVVIAAYGIVSAQDSSVSFFLNVFRWNTLLFGE